MCKLLPSHLYEANAQESHYLLEVPGLREAIRQHGLCGAMAQVIKIA